MLGSDTAIFQASVCNECSECMQQAQQSCIAGQIRLRSLQTISALECKRGKHNLLALCQHEQQRHFAGSGVLRAQLIDHVTQHQLQLVSTVILSHTMPINFARFWLDSQIMTAARNNHLLHLSASKLCWQADLLVYLKKAHADRVHLLLGKESLLAWVC